MLALLIFAVVMGSYLLGRYEERMKHEDQALEALKRILEAPKRINERGRHG